MNKIRNKMKGSTEEEKEKMEESTKEENKKKI